MKTMINLFRGLVNGIEDDDIGSLALPQEVFFFTQYDKWPSPPLCLPQKRCASPIPVSLVRLSFCGLSFFAGLSTASNYAGRGDGRT